MDEPISRQLLAHAASIHSLRQDFDQMINEFTDALADLVTRMESLELGSEHRTNPTTPWCWRDIGREASIELTAQLSEWVAWVRSRYPLARKIPDCWAKHPETVEELTALWLAWQAAYQDNNAPFTAAADWHDRWLPGFLSRIEHGALAIACATIHQARPSSSYLTIEAARDQCAAESPAEF